MLALYKPTKNSMKATLAIRDNEVVADNQKCDKATKSSIRVANQLYTRELKKTRSI